MLLWILIVLGTVCFGFALKWMFWDKDFPEIHPFESKDAQRLMDLEKDLEKCVEALEMIYHETEDDRVGFIACSALDTLTTYDWGNR